LLRLRRLASSDSRKRRTHIAHGLKPSTSPITIVKIGSPSARARIVPTRGSVTSSEAGAKVVSSQGTCGSIEQVPASWSPGRLPGALAPASSASIRRPVVAAPVKPTTNLPRTQNAGTLTAPISARSAMATKRLRPDGSTTSVTTIVTSGRRACRSETHCCAS
jgi:hypothetical protein